MSVQSKTILEEILKRLGFNAKVEEFMLEEGPLLQVTADDPGRLIGRKGQTLSSLQYIVNRMIFQADPRAPKVIIDVANYRTQAREALIKKAKDAAEKVRRWGDIIELEPMNAFDRFIVHNALKDDPNIETKSVPVEGSNKKAVLLRPKQ
jgi:spoIIIJ-associated protein